MLFQASEIRKRMPPDVIWFCSGANRCAEIEGLNRLGIPVGASVDQLSSAAITILTEAGRPAMADSGAFSEVRFVDQEWQSVNAISHHEWKRRLAIYFRLAEALQSKLTCVAPDRVGSQKDTLARLELYRNQLAEIAASGATVLLPLQTGPMSHEVFYRHASEACGLEVVPAMPLRKAVTGLVEMAEFLSLVRPKRVHLLGIGPENRKAWNTIRLIRFYSSGTEISMDSNGLRAKLGAGRALSVCETRLRTDVVGSVYGAVESEILDTLDSALDYTEAIASPSTWMSREALSRLADTLALDSSEIARLLEAPDTFLQSAYRDADLRWIEHPVMSHALDCAWERHVEKTCRRSLRTAAIVATFAESIARSEP